MLLLLLSCHANTDAPRDSVADSEPRESVPDTDSAVDSSPDSSADSARETGHDTGPIPIGGACVPGEDTCEAGAGCCTPCCALDAAPVCAALEADGACPLPDLTVDAEMLASSHYVTEEEFAADACAIEEACVGAPGWRRLLRFTTKTPNIGTANLTLGYPSDDPARFQWSECHGHWHMTDYIDYALVDATGGVVATGRKQAFCLMDSEPVADTPQPPSYHCGYQGITVGWADTYTAWLDCQWLDVTDVPAGDYILRLTLDPLGLLRERDTTNNVVEVGVTLADVEDVFAACDPVAVGEDRNCGWSDAGMLPCTPGEEVTVGCEGACDGGCEGDPVLRVCDPAAPSCTASTALGSNDDADCGSACPMLTVECPDGGEIQVLTGAWSSDEAASCAVTTD